MVLNPVCDAAFLLALDSHFPGEGVEHAETNGGENSE